MKKSLTIKEQKERAEFEDRMQQDGKNKSISRVHDVEYESQANHLDDYEDYTELDFND